jgi:hypothetical protein
MRGLVCDGHGLGHFDNNGFPGRSRVGTFDVAIQPNIRPVLRHDRAARPSAERLRQAIWKIRAAKCFDERMLKSDIAAGSPLSYLPDDDRPRGGAHDPVFVNRTALSFTRIRYGAQTILVREFLEIKLRSGVVSHITVDASGALNNGVISYSMAGEETMARYVAHQPDARPTAKVASVQTAPASAAEPDTGIVSDAFGLQKATLERRLRRQIHDVMDGRSFFDKYSVEAVCMRILLTMGAIQEYFREERPSDRALLLHDLRRLLPELEESGLYDAEIRGFIDGSIRYLEADAAAAPLQAAGGGDEELSELVRRIPTMLCKETLGYYKWLARTLVEPGVIVELGSWMGSSTACLAEGLAQNTNRKDRKIHVYDSFIWRDWMKAYTEDAELLASNIREGESFTQHFWHYAEPFRHLIDVHQSVLKTGTEQFALPALDWRDGQIAILVMDFAHDRASNEAMWRVFSPSFRSGSTIVVFNQFGNIPAGEVRDFCRDRARELVPLHKPRSSAKAFRYQKAIA